MPRTPQRNAIGDVLGLVEIAVYLGVELRTPHTWKNRGRLPDPDHRTVNGRNAWNRDTILQFAADTERLNTRALRDEARQKGITARPGFERPLGGRPRTKVEEMAG